MSSADSLSRAYLDNRPEKPTPQNDICSIKERVFAPELEQIRHSEDVSVSPVRLKRLREMKDEGEELTNVNLLGTVRQLRLKPVNLTGGKSK